MLQWRSGELSRVEQAERDELLAGRRSAGRKQADRDHRGNLRHRAPHDYTRCRLAEWSEDWHVVPGYILQEIDEWMVAGVQVDWQRVGKGSPTPKQTQAQRQREDKQKTNRNTRSEGQAHRSNMCWDQEMGKPLWITGTGAKSGNIQDGNFPWEIHGK